MTDFELEDARRVVDVALRLWAEAQSLVVRDGVDYGLQVTSVQDSAIAEGAGVALEAVRACLRQLDGSVFAVGYDDGGVLTVKAPIVRLDD